MRHWRKAPVTINAAPPKDPSMITGIRTVGWPELPMPRDAHLLSPMSRELLRAARMGQTFKQPPLPLEDEKEFGDDDDINWDIEAGFVAKRWSLVPRNMEEAEPEYLAKRRKGLPSVYTGGTVPLSTMGQMRKTKIQKTDAEGNVYVWDVLVPEGQTVEGEVMEEEPLRTEAPAPGTVVEGVGVVNAEGLVVANDPVQPAPPTRRRPPPPKRRAKGPGRGRKKRVGFVSISGGGPLPKKGNVNGASATPISDAGANGKPHSPTDRNIEPREDVNLPLDGDEVGEDDLSDSSSIDDLEDPDREEGELSPSPSLPPEPPLPTFSQPPETTRIHYPLPASPAPPLNREPSSSPDLPLATQVLQTPLIKIDAAHDPIPAPAPPKIQGAPITPYIPASGNLSTYANFPAVAQPSSSPAMRVSTDEGTPDVRFPDGEEDLLGSLERSLGQRGGGKR